MVQALIKSGDQITEELTPEQCEMMHYGCGVAGEGGELLDAIKKHCIYRQPLDRENVIEEMGDSEFYLEALRKLLGITRKETIAANMAKLAKRYEGFKYSDEAAQLRKDKE